MKRHFPFTLKTLLAILLCAGCATHHPQMTKQSVIQIANFAAEQSGFHLTDYRKPQASFNFTSTNYAWSVTFETISDESHPKLWIQVDDKTGATKVLEVPFLRESEGIQTTFQTR
jgi:hypothetical protein